MREYKDMINRVLDVGTRKENRTGVDTISTFNWNYALSWDLLWARCETRLTEGHPVPLLTTKEISWKNIVVELLWFLSGDTNIEFLRRHGCKFWDAWADKNGHVPSAYGNFWRRFPSTAGSLFHFPSTAVSLTGGAFTNDQLAWIVDTLRRDPMNRRCVMTAWAPDNAQTSKLPPCHFATYFNVQNDLRGEQRLCLHLTQRSCDLALGVPYNMASYGLLLLLMSQLLHIKPGVFAHTLCDLHIYTKKPGGDQAEYDHIPGLKEQLARATRPLPRVVIDPGIRELADIQSLLRPEVTTAQILDAFRLVGYNPHPPIHFKVAV